MRMYPLAQLVDILPPLPFIYLGWASPAIGLALAGVMYARWPRRAWAVAAFYAVTFPLAVLRSPAAALTLYLILPPIGYVIGLVVLVRPLVKRDIRRGFDVVMPDQHSNRKRLD